MKVVACDGRLGAQSSVSCCHREMHGRNSKRTARRIRQRVASGVTAARRMNLLPTIPAAFQIAALTAAALTPQPTQRRADHTRRRRRAPTGNELKLKSVHPAQPAARAGPDRRWRRSIARSGRGSAESGESKLRGPRGGFHRQVRVSPGPGRTCAPSDALMRSRRVSWGHAVWIQGSLIVWDEFDTGRASGGREGASGEGPVSGLRSVAGRLPGTGVEFELLDEGREGLERVGDQCLCGALRGSLKRGA